jgi:hypothetical protein
MVTLRQAADHVLVGLTNPPLAIILRAGRNCGGPLRNYGALTLRPGGLVLVSELMRGVMALEQLLTRYHGERARSVVNPSYAPASSNLDWH